MFFSPLSFTFWRGIIWIPEMRGKGVSKSVSLLVFFCSYVLFYRVAPKLFQIIILFGFNFGDLFLVSWISLDIFCGPPWASWIFFCVALRAKKCRMSHAKMAFLKRLFFLGVFDLLMVFMGSSRLLLGRCSPRMDSNMSLKISSDSSQQYVNFEYKTCKSGQQKFRQYLFKMRSPP